MTKAAPGVSPALKIRESQTAARRNLLKAVGAPLLSAPATHALDARFAPSLCGTATDAIIRPRSNGDRRISKPGKGHCLPPDRAPSWPQGGRS